MNRHKVKYKNFVIVAFIVLLWLPFATFKNYYPFLRFGMFAELGAQPTGKTKEQFEIFFIKNDRKVKFAAPMMGMNAATFEYLKRNYFYRGETDKLLNTVVNRFENGDDFRWDFYKISSREKEGIDSLLVSSFP